MSVPVEQERRAGPNAPVGEELIGAYGENWLAAQLPGVFASDPFMVRFLRIFQDVADRVRWPIEHLEHYVRPDVAPVEVLDWLGTWLGLVLDRPWTSTHQRRFVQQIGPLLRTRGTEACLVAVLKLATGADVQVVEDSGGVTISEAYVDRSEYMKSVRSRHVSVHVTHLVMPRVNDRELSEGAIKFEVERLIQLLVPADIVLTIEHRFDVSRPGNASTAQEEPA